MTEMPNQTSDHPRDDLMRRVEWDAGQVEFRASTDPDDGRLGTLQGYAAVFNQDTLIDSWEGRFYERLMPGAFRKTLEERGDKIKILFDHGMDPSIGNKPLGKPSRMEETERGLWIEVPLDDTSYNRDIVASLRSGALDGMSFRFSVVRDDWETRDGVEYRTIKEVKLYEAGPVTFPAYEATTAGIRGARAFQAWTVAHPHTEPVFPPADTGSGPDDAPADSGSAANKARKAEQEAILHKLEKALSRNI